MRYVSIFELRKNLSRFLALVAKGERVVVTSRGTPVAVIHSLGEAKGRGLVEKKLAALAAVGAIKLPAKGKKLDMRTKPVPIRGKPASETMLEDRR